MPSRYDVTRAHGKWTSWDEEDHYEDRSLSIRARNAGRTIGEQWRYEDAKPQAELDALHAAGVRGWWPPYSGNPSAWAARLTYLRSMRFDTPVSYTDGCGNEKWWDEAHKAGRQVHA